MPYRKVEKCLRDAKLLQIYEGTNQLNRLKYVQVFHSEPIGVMETGFNALCKLVEPICQLDASFGSIIFTSTFAYERIFRGVAPQKSKFVEGI